MGDLLPAETVYRPEKGFPFPWDTWLRNELREYCENAIEKLSVRGLLNEKAVLALWQRFLSGDKQIMWMHIWSLVILEGWLTENGNLKNNCIA